MTKDNTTPATPVTVLIDNYDSFTWNVYQFLSELGANIVVFRNDQVSLDEIIALRPRNIVISPGPGKPADAAISLNVIKYFSGKIPILGVCLGEQCMFEVFGGIVTYAGQIVHGKTSTVSHDSRGLYENVPQNIQITRYHSLAGDPSTLPDCLEVTSQTQDGIIMGVRHKTFVVEGVQYHPESIASQGGKRLFANFLKWEGGTWDSLSYRDDLVRWDVVTSSVKNKVKKKSEISIHGLDVAELAQLNCINSNNANHENKESPLNQDQSILEVICEQRRKDVQQTQSLPGKSMLHLERSFSLGIAPPLVDFYQRILQDTSSVAVMAEVKRASPSKKDICLHAHATSQALEYALGGASVISVLTEPTWFKGSLQDLQDVRRMVDKLPNRPAILRKDFIFDEYQILEARLAGADTCLLIVATLHQNSRLISLIDYARQLGMEPLVEVANAEETQRAVKCGAKVIGINNRDLHTFNLDSDRTVGLSSLIPKDIIVVALSGIQGHEDVQKYTAAGARGVLVGEALMRSKNTREFIQKLKYGGYFGTSCDATEKSKITTTGTVSYRAKIQKAVHAKICGVTSMQDAEKVAASGASFIGLIFAKSPRQVTVERAKEIVQHFKNNHESLISVEHQPDLPWSFYESIAKYSSTKWFEICRQLIESQVYVKQRPLFVGVFANSTAAEINHVIEQTGIDLVQFHGDESPQLAKLISRPCIKAYHVMEGDSADKIISRIQNQATHCLAMILLDAGIKNSSHQGGSGQTFNWAIAKHVASSLKTKLMVAGGLTPDNVDEAINEIGPENIFAVDCSSGVETNVKGVKDHSKIAEFTSKVFL